MANIRTGGKQSGTGSTAGALLRGVPTGILSTFLSALLFAAILLAGEDPSRLLGLFAYAALFIGAAVCGVVSAVYDRSRAGINTAFGEGVYTLVMFAVSLFLSGSTGGTVNVVEALLAYGGCILTALIIGLIIRPRRVRIGEGAKNPAAIARKQLGRR